MAGVFIGHPFDTIKVLMQTDSKYKSPIKCLRSVMKSDGIRSLYNGILPPLAIATAINATLFFSYEYSLRIISKQKPSSNESPENVPPALTQVILAGSFAGFIQTGVCVPAEVVFRFGEQITVQPTYSDDHTSGHQMQATSWRIFWRRRLCAKGIEPHLTAPVLSVTRFVGIEPRRLAPSCIERKAGRDSTAEPP